MKEIKNWTIVFQEETGNRGIGILLPGCIVIGIVSIGCLEDKIEVKVADVDISNLVITSNEGEKYKLVNASREYLQDIKKCIKIGLNERNGEER